jgi:hypothetical protein
VKKNNLKGTNVVCWTTSILKGTDAVWWVTSILFIILLVFCVFSMSMEYINILKNKSVTIIQNITFLIGLLTICWGWTVSTRNIVFWLRKRYHRKKNCTKNSSTNEYIEKLRYQMEHSTDHLRVANLSSIGEILMKCTPGIEMISICDDREKNIVKIGVQMKEGFEFTNKIKYIMLRLCKDLGDTKSKYEINDVKEEGLPEPTEE